jgi:hypothetical protein
MLLFAAIRTRLFFNAITTTTETRRTGHRPTDRRVIRVGHSHRLTLAKTANKGVVLRSRNSAVLSRRIPWQLNDAISSKLAVAAAAVILARFRRFLK